MKGNAVDDIAVPGQRVQQPPRLRRSQLHGPIIAATGQHLVIRADGDRLHAVGVALEDVQQLR